MIIVNNIKCHLLKHSLEKTIFGNDMLFQLRVIYVRLFGFLIAYTDLLERILYGGYEGSN